MNSSNITLMLNELEYFTPKLEGWRQYIFTGAATLIAIVAFIVQRAVYRTIKRLGSRHINQIIIPSLVSKCLFVFLFCFYIAQAGPKAGWPEGWLPEGWLPEGWPEVNWSLKTIFIANHYRSFST